MPATKLREFLDRYHVRYVSTSHSPAYTAQEIAAHAHVPGKHLAKTVIVKLNGKMAMVVLPASLHVDFELLEKATGARDVKLASESEFKLLFPDCEIGAMPPFGNLYGVPVYLAAELAEDEEIVFNAGTHHELIRMKCADFERLVKPAVARVSDAAIH